MSNGPWKITGDFADTYPYYKPGSFYPQERTFNNFPEAGLALSHLIAHGQGREFRGALNLINEDGAVIAVFEPNDENLGEKTLLVETNVDLEDIKKFYRHGYRVEDEIRFYYRFSATDLTVEQKTTLNYLITVLMNTTLYMSGPELIHTVFEGNKDSLYTMVLNNEWITPAILSRAMKGLAVLNGREFV